MNTDDAILLAQVSGVLSSWLAGAGDETEGRALLDRVNARIELVETGRDPLERLVRLHAHYATLLNTYDGGERVVLRSAADWLERLRELDEVFG